MLAAWRYPTKRAREVSGSGGAELHRNRPAKTEAFPKPRLLCRPRSTMLVVSVTDDFRSPPPEEGTVLFTVWL